jgi:uncharacterized repeat protein (TIGR02543 family)
MYARWTPITYTITYNLDGGANPEAPPTSYTVESAEIKLPTPTKKPSYSFGGWFDNSGFAGTALTSIARGSTGDKTLWVKWNETGLMGTISYWVNEQGQISSTGSPATVSKTGNPLTITADGAGYSDQHWSINGVEDVSAAGQASYDFSGADKDTKTYTVGLRVKKDNQYYAVQFAVMVTD